MFAVASLTLRRFLRERSNLFFVFVLPLAIIFLVGYSAGTRVDTRLAVVGADTTAGASVLAQLPNDRVDLHPDEASAERAVADGDVAGMVVFPTEAGESIQFRSRQNTGLDLRILVDNAVATENQRSALELRSASTADPARFDAARSSVGETPVVTETVGQVVWGGLADIDASALTQVVLFMFLSALTSASFLVQDRAMGMATRKAAAPISIRRLVLGEALGRLAIAAFQALLIVTLTGLLFGVSWGHPLGTGTILILFALVSTGVAVLLGAALDNPENANGIGIMISLVLASLGGAMAPVEIFPEVMQRIARFTPHYWAIDGLQSSLSRGALDDMGRPIVVLVLAAISVLAASMVILRRRMFSAHR